MHDIGVIEDKMWKVSYREPCAVMIGNESRGLTDSLTDLAAEKILIPMRGKTESLNAAMAAGIIMYEAARQRGFS